MGASDSKEEKKSSDEPKFLVNQQLSLSNKHIVRNNLINKSTSKEQSFKTINKPKYINNKNFTLQLKTIFNQLLVQDDIVCIRSNSFNESIFKESFQEPIKRYHSHDNYEINKNSLFLKDNEKDKQNIRYSYIEKLISCKIWKKEEDFNNIIIFDWDDTLLCTTFLTPKGIYDEKLVLNSKQQDQISKLEKFVYNLLNKCIKNSDTYIVTNASKGWVEFSTKKYYPSVLPLLINIRILSARELFNKEFMLNNRQWKIETFKLIVNNYNKKLVTNLMCIGDSYIEMEAGQIIAKTFSKAYIKSVKFKETPKIEELIKQLSLLSIEYDSIFKSLKKLNITVERKEK